MNTKKDSWPEEFIKYHDKQLKKILTILQKILKKGEQIMGAMDDLSQGITDLGTAQASEADSLTNIAADIKNLQTQIGNGGTITEAQLQPLADKVKAAAATAKATSDAMKALADSVPDVPPSGP
jgi:methyl-accepting chemotaxis protein